MRTIKFRVWHKKMQRMYEVLTLNFKQQMLSSPCRDGCETGIDGFSFDEMELVQFTGLVDKHGKEIYEGDIIQRSTIKVPLLVRWNQKEAKFDVAKDPDNFNATVIWYTQLIEEEYEIIGNIYENPELMRGGKV